VPVARRLLTSSMTSRDFMTSYSWCHNLQSRCIFKLRPGSTISAWTCTQSYNIVFF